LTALLLAAVIGMLVIIPPRFWTSLPTVCLNRRLFGFCPACGTVRALAQLFHGNLAAAVRSNPNCVVTGPLLWYLFLSECIQAVRCGRRAGAD